MSEALTITQTPKGNIVRFWTRLEVNDEALVLGILGGDEYRLADLPPLSGWALDVGAHIGTVGIALAMDHPDLSVLMIEPVPDNAALIRRSIAENGLTARCHVLEAMGGKGEGTATCRYAYTHLEGFEDQGYVAQNAYIGGIWRLTDHERVQATAIEVPIVDTERLALDYPIGAFAITKIDCEGCEWDFLDGLGRRISGWMYPLIIGEWHDGPPSKIRTLLRGYRVEILDDHGGSGIFRARAK